MQMSFRDVLHRLRDGKVAFLVVGGVACAMNGFVRATDDVDIIVDAAPENVRRLLTVLSGWGDGCAVELQAEDFSEEPGAIRLIEDFPLDMFTVMNGKTYRDFLVNATTTDDGIGYLCLADLIHTKTGSVREKDQIDVHALRRLLSTGADVNGHE